MKTRSSPDKPKRESLLKKVSEVSKDTDPDDTSDSIETPFPKNTPGTLQEQQIVLFNILLRIPILWKARCLYRNYNPGNKAGLPHRIS